MDRLVRLGEVVVWASAVVLVPFAPLLGFFGLCVAAVYSFWKMIRAGRA